MRLEIVDLHVSIDSREIINGLNLTVASNEVHAIMGPNGSGKSTLAYTLLGHPRYTVSKGDIRLDGESILELSTDERARKGLFLGFQYPVEISGVSFSNFLRNAYNIMNKSYKDKSREVFLTVREFHDYMRRQIDLVGLDGSFLTRYLNEGFSGGEKKRSEVLQMLVLRPRLAILDEPDSGLDIDAVKAVANAINNFISNDTSVLVITHYARILRYLKKLDYVHVMADGKIVRSGGKELAEMLEEKGYSWIEREAKERAGSSS
ncbi:MAG: Fe-S cluster assembly ATPase SufC [Candidatus Nitrosocaldus sp.]